MLYVLIYLVFGLGLVSLCKTHEGVSVLKTPGVAAVLVLIWPAIAWRCIFNAEKITWKGKVIWERK